LDPVGAYDAAAPRGQGLASGTLIAFHEGFSVGVLNELSAARAEDGLATVSRCFAWKVFEGTPIELWQKSQLIQRDLFQTGIWLL
jgi:hypothetical protein